MTEPHRVVGRCRDALAAAPRIAHVAAIHKKFGVRNYGIRRFRVALSGVRPAERGAEPPSPCGPIHGCRGLEAGARQALQCTRDRMQSVGILHLWIGSELSGSCLRRNRPTCSPDMALRRSTPSEARMAVPWKNLRTCCGWIRTTKPLTFTQERHWSGYAAQRRQRTCTRGASKLPSVPGMSMPEPNWRKLLPLSPAECLCR